MFPQKQRSSYQKIGVSSILFYADELSLDWSDEEDLDESGEKKQISQEVKENKSNNYEPSIADNSGSVDIIAQHLKFVASLRILTEELSTLASGFEVDGGELRYQLFIWLEKEVEVLQNLCDYRSQIDSELEDVDEDSQVTIIGGSNQALHEALQKDRSEIVIKLKIASKRRKWLIANQKLLRCYADEINKTLIGKSLFRSFTSYCVLHSAQNHRLTSALMELLLLLLEVQKDTGVQHLNERISDAIFLKEIIHLETVPDMNSFPLLVSSVSSTKMFVSSPLSFIENQCYDLLSTIADMTSVPDIDNHLQKVITILIIQMIFLNFTPICQAYMLYNLSQGLSSCLYQSLCDVDQFSIPFMYRTDSKPGILTRRSRVSSGVDEIRVTTPPARWPGVDNLVALLSREKDDEAPHLRLLLAECFVAITMSLFCFALASYDSRWLYRLAGHQIDPVQFSLIFGGGGEKKLKAVPPARPPSNYDFAVSVIRNYGSILGPAAPRIKSISEASTVSSDGTTISDGGVLRSKLHAKVFGADATVVISPSMQHSPVLEQTIMKWVPPQKNIVQFYADKPPIHTRQELGIDFDSDDESDSSIDSDADDERSVNLFSLIVILEDQNRYMLLVICRCEQANPTSFAWQLMRLALIEQQIYRIRQFLMLAGFDISDIPGMAPRVEAVLRLLDGWAMQQRQYLYSCPGGFSADILPNMGLDLSDGHMGPTPKKYASLIEKDNTPFESDDSRAPPLKRLWAFLVREDHLQNLFIRYVFAVQGQQEHPSERNDTLAGIENQALPDAFKIIQKDNEPIVAFACNQEVVEILEKMVIHRRGVW
uniref:FPL domain-containing protein n=1 Tax=Heterorhabditis bacteriophora TaxID=37862 RepID=A0A1I7WD23_HETBA